MRLFWPISIVLLIPTTPASLVAQSAACTVSLESPSVTVDQGTPVVFTARLKGSESISEVKYKWHMSAGSITAGEGSSAITVDTMWLAGQSITATVEVFQNGQFCSTTSKKKVDVVGPAFICGLAFDEYADIGFEDEKARLDNFAIQLMNTPTARGALLAFAGNPTYRGEAAHRLQRAKNYIVKVRGIAPERVITIDSGFRTDFSISLYIVPAGATLPVLDSLSLDPSQIRFTKRRPTKKM